MTSHSKGAIRGALAARVAARASDNADVIIVRCFDM